MGEIMNDRLLRFAERTSSENEESTLEEMCQRVTEAKPEDGDPLRSMCVSWDIPYGRFVSWLEEGEDRMGRYEAALRIRADGLLHRALCVAATPQAGVVTKEGPDGVVTTTEDMLGHRKLQVDTSLKVAAKWDARRFGDSSRVEVGLKSLKVSEVSLLEGARRIAFAMARGAHLAEQKKREPRLLEATAVREVEPVDTPYDPGV